MCGIAGILGPGAPRESVQRMIDALSRRGPDDHGIWQDPSGGAVLGQTRLSIIDLSSAGHQPMTHGNGRYWITFNGEIFNYQDLRRTLEADGVAFASHTDTEVILAAFARWGTESWQRLRGMFAFVLWDSHEKCAYLVRDRMGIKPLLWAKAAGQIVASSEIKGILASGLIDPVLEPRAVWDLLARGSVCQPGTILRGVRAVEPGTCLMIPSGKEPQTQRYWSAAQASAARRTELAKLTYTDIVSLIRRQLEEACRYHLISDVPVGSFLSGGIDSTAVTALMSRQMSGRVKSFSVGFDDTSELPHELDAARRAANYIGCEHTEVMVTGGQVADAFDDLVRTIDQPSYDGTNTYFVSRAARAAVKVTLSGLGGDELFAGYTHFQVLRDAERWSTSKARWLLGSLHRLRSNRWTAAPAMACRRPVTRYAGLRRILGDSAVRQSLAEPFRACFQSEFLEAHVLPMLDAALDSVCQTSLVECGGYLLDTLLRDADSMSMGHGLEVRPVLLDHVLVEHALALPPEAKIRRGQRKAALIDAVRDLLPPDLLTRAKTGFELPLGTWLRSVLRQRLVDCLNDPWARALFDQHFLAQRLRRVDHRGEASLLWTLLILISWAREHRCRLPG